MSCIVWFRNDLRLHDNEVVHRATTEGEEVLPVYCFDPRHYRDLKLGFRKTGIHRFRFLVESLEDLSKRIQQRGGRLLIVVGQPEDVLPELATHHGISRILAQREIASEETTVERKVRDRMKTIGGELELIWGKTLYHLDDIPFEPDNIPLTSKAFRIPTGKATKPRAEYPTPDKIHVPRRADWGSWPEPSELGYTEGEIQRPTQQVYHGGETKGLARLEEYTFGTELLSRYKYTRNRSLGLDYSSKLSPWMAHGCLSPRRIYWEVKRYEAEVKKNISTWWLVFEIVWRDYFKFLGLRFGDRMFAAGGIRGRDVGWVYDESLFSRWRQGRTGIPFLDAHLIELKTTGFMSNRGRVNAASFLTRDYRIDWRWGAAWFEHHLLDYDVCSNWLNWNTQATEIYYTNPVHQAMKYDKDGAYTLHWLPRLAALPDPLYHAPWLVDKTERDRLGIPHYEPPVEVYKKWNRSINNIKKAAGLE